jgi:hypothetical protein
MRLMRGRWRDGAGIGDIPGPNQQHWARSVVDDEPAGRPEALRPQAGVVAVPGQDEQFGAFGRRDDLALYAPVALHG